MSDIATPSYIDAIANKLEAEDRPLRDERTARYRIEPGSSHHYDESPVLWGIEDRVPSIPAQALDVVVDPTLPQWITSSFEPDFERRNEFWVAYARKAEEAQQKHSSMVPAWNSYQGVHEQARTHEGGDISARTEAHRVPNRGGVSIGSLFDGSRLRSNDGDRVAVEEAHTAVSTGRGGVEEASAASRTADDGVKKARLALDGHRRTVLSLASKLAAAADQIEIQVLQRQADVVQAEIDEIKQRVGVAKLIVRTLKDIAAAVLHTGAALGAGGVASAGDAASAIGDVLIDGVEIGETILIGRKTEPLDKIKLAQSALVDARQRKEFNALLHDAAAAQNMFLAADVGLRIALDEQRMKYREFGTSAAAVTTGSKEAKTRLEAVLSSIPIVSEAISRAATLASTSAKVAIDLKAMRGLGIATVHKHPSATPFVRATNELRTVETIARVDERKWRTRVEQLFKVRDDILKEDT